MTSVNVVMAALNLSDDIKVNIVKIRCIIAKRRKVISIGEYYRQRYSDCTYV